MSIATSKEKLYKNTTTYGIVFAISISHFLNDALQSVVRALNPIFVTELGLSYFQIGLIIFVLNMTSSILQPIFGYVADKRPAPYLLPIGMFISMVGLLALALAPNIYLILLSVLFMGIGTAVFHPEGARVVHMAAGQRRGLSQSIYQVGGNFGQSLGPIFTALIFVQLGQKGLFGFLFVAFIALLLLMKISKWYKTKLNYVGTVNSKTRSKQQTKLPFKILFAITLLVFLVFARSLYIAGINNYYQFYLIEDYGLTIKGAQIFIFIFMLSSVLGTFFGGPLADKFGKKNIMLFSMAGVAPITIILPYSSLNFIMPQFIVIGFIITLSFSVAVVYAQELLPKSIGLVSGLIVGFSFGMGAVGTVIFGFVADQYSIRFIMLLCSFIPLIGLLSILLPSDNEARKLGQQL